MFLGRGTHNHRHSVFPGRHRHLLCTLERISGNGRRNGLESCSGRIIHSPVGSDVHEGIENMCDLSGGKILGMVISLVNAPAVWYVVSKEVPSVYEEFMHEKQPIDKIDRVDVTNSSLRNIQTQHHCEIWLQEAKSTR